MHFLLQMQQLKTTQKENPCKKFKLQVLRVNLAAVIKY